MKNKQRLLSIIVLCLLSIFVFACANNEGGIEDGRQYGKYKPLTEAELERLVNVPDTNFKAKVTTSYPLGDVVVQTIKIDGNFDKEKITSLKASYETEDDIVYLEYLAGVQMYEINNIDGEWLAHAITTDKSLYMMFTNLKDFLTVDYLKTHFDESNGTYYIKNYYIDGLRTVVNFKVENNHITYLDFDAGRYKKVFEISDFNETTIEMPKYRVENYTCFPNTEKYFMMVNNVIRNTNINNLTLKSVTTDADVEYRLALDSRKYFKKLNEEANYFMLQNNTYYQVADGTDELLLVTSQEYDDNLIDIEKLLSTLLAFVDLKHFECLDYSTFKNNLHIVGTNIPSVKYGNITRFEMVVQKGSLFYLNFTTTVMKIEFSSIGRTKVDLPKVQYSSDEEVFKQQLPYYLAELLSHLNINNLTLKKDNETYQFDFENNLIVKNDDEGSKSYLSLDNKIYYINSSNDNKIEISNNQFAFTDLESFINYILQNIGEDVELLSFDPENNEFHIKSGDFEIVISQDDITSMGINDYLIEKINQTDLEDINWQKSDKMVQQDALDSFFSIVTSPNVFRNFSDEGQLGEQKVVGKMDFEQLISELHYEDIEIMNESGQMEHYGKVDIYAVQKDGKYYSHVVYDGFKSDTKEITFDEYYSYFDIVSGNLLNYLNYMVEGEFNATVFDLDNGNLDLTARINEGIYTTDIHCVIENYVITTFDRTAYLTSNGDYVGYEHVYDVNKTVIENPLK